MEKHPARKGGGEAGAGERRNRDAINYFMLQKPEQVHVMWAPYGSSDLTFTVALKTKLPPSREMRVVSRATRFL